MTPAERDAFDAECTPHRDVLFGIALCVCKTRAAAEDLVQTTFLNAMLSWPSFRPGSSSRAWLYRILTNAFIHDYRRRKRFRRIVDECAADVESVLYDQGEAPETTLSPEVQDALDALDANCRAVVERAAIRGLKCKDIAIELDMPIGTVMSRLYRARKTLRPLLEGLARERGLAPVAPVAENGARRKAA